MRGVAEVERGRVQPGHQLVERILVLDLAEPAGRGRAGGEETVERGSKLAFCSLLVANGR